MRVRPAGTYTMKTHPRCGFTMAELLASISIIALSMAICLPVPDTALDEEALVDPGPVTVRIFECKVDGQQLDDVECQAREALVGTDLQFCALETFEDRHYILSVWSPANIDPEANREQLQAHLGSGWIVEHTTDYPDELVAMN